MKNFTKIKVFGLIFIVLVLMLAACNSEGSNDNNESAGSQTEEQTVNGEKSEEETEQEPEREPVTLKFNYGWEEEFIEDIKGPVEEKFPWITLEFVELALENVEEEIAKNNIPDIFYLSGGDQVPYLLEYELAFDHDELIEKHGFDLSKISEAHIEKARTWGDGALYYLPYVRRWEVLYYNKAVFDAFGEEYPTDGMTWKEVADLARKVTGERNGTEYRGIDISASSGMLDQLGVNFVDPETHEPMFLKDEGFAKYLGMIEEFASIPGVIPEEGDWGDFIGKQNVAMVPLFDIHIWLKNVEAETGLAWDMVSYPVWEDQPNVGPSANAAGLAISATSEHKEEAFMVLEYLLSEEWQMMRSKKGFATVLNNTEIQEAFCSEVEGLEEKNMQDVFALEATSGPEKLSPYEDVAKEVFDIMEFIKSDKDVNTYLREVYDKADAKVKEALGSN